MQILGIDIGGTGIKAAIVDTITGELVTDRHRIPTPKPADPKAVAMVIKELIDQFNWQGPVGCCFPTTIVNGQCMHYSNMHKSWLNVKVDKLFKEECNGFDFYVSNDADLAGFAEVSLGAGKGISGKVIVITVGTGIGSGLFYDGNLIPNVELGHIFHPNGDIIEKFTADSVRRKEDLSLKKWAKRLDFFFNHVKVIHSPELFILGGGISKKFEKYKEHFTVDVPIKVARFGNNAGIIGAAMYAKQQHSK